MFIVLGLFGGIFAALVILSREEQGNLLCKISMYIYKKVVLKYPGQWVGHLHKETVHRNLMQLHPGEQPEYLEMMYYVGKLQMVLMVLLGGSILAFCAEVSGGSAEIQVSGGIVRRGSSSEEIVLEAHLSGEEKFQERITLEIAERVLTEEEANSLYQEFLPELELIMLGENLSFQEIRQNLNLPYELEGYPFGIEWRSEDSSLLGYDGVVHTSELEAAVSVTLSADISYSEMRWKKVWQLELQPPIRTQREQLVYDLTRLSKEASLDHQYEESFQLPEMLAGEAVSWHMVKDSSGNMILVLTFAAAVAIYFMKDQDLQKDLVKRRKMLRQEYPVLVSKYALYLGAGMTVRGTFQRICREYYEKPEYSNSAEWHPLYEEMLYSCNELKAGVSESRVYEHFGRRTGVQEYTRFCALLSQNLKKGNSTLVQRLKEECENAMRENMHLQKRQGEEAETKLLLPMVMLLLLILVLIMLPAFSGIGI